MKSQLHFPYGYPHTCYRTERRRSWPRIMGWLLAVACWIPVVALWVITSDMQNI
jgi:hypothetical protein